MAEDIAAIYQLTRLSREWVDLSNVPSEVTLEATQLLQTKVTNTVARTENCLTRVKTYAGSINKEISSLQALVKESLIHTVEIMKDLTMRLVPEEKTETEDIHPNTAFGQYDGQSKTLPTNDNQQTAEMLQMIAQLAAKQQKMESMLESINNVCQNIKNHDGIDSDDIRNLQKEINSYGDTLESEKERREREERKIREKQKRDEEERKRKEAEEKRRNPANWNPLIMLDPKGKTGLVSTDIHCVIYAIPGSVTDGFLQSINNEKRMYPKEWLNIPYEQQASSPLIVEYKGNMSLDLEMPLEIYVPYIIENNKYEPEIKICVDNGSWEYPDIIKERTVDAFPEGVKYIGTKLQKFQSFKIIVVAVSGKKAIKVDDAGVSFKYDSMEFVLPPSTFGKTCNIKLGVSKDPESTFSKLKDTAKKTNVTAAQVHVDLDCRTKTQKEITVNISTGKLQELFLPVESQFKETMAAQKILLDLHRSPDVPTTFQIDHFLDELSKMTVIDEKDTKENKNLKKADDRLKHLFELLSQKPSDLKKVLVCLDKSENNEMTNKIRQRLEEIKMKRLAEEEHRPVMVYRVRGGKWNVLDPKTSARLHQKMGCILPAGHRYFEFMSLAVPDASIDIQSAADRIRKKMLGTTVTLLCRQKEDDQGDTFIHILPTKRANAELRRLKEHGYTRGPMELSDFTVADGETIQIHMSENIGIEHNSIRKPQGETLSIPFKVNKDISKLNCRVYVLNKDDQMDDERYHGLLHYQIKELEPMEHRSDKVEITWEKMTKAHLSHLSINGEIQALAKFIGLRIKTKEEVHVIFSTMDKRAVVKEIEARVARNCKDDSDQVKCETTIFIWANQNQKDNKEKIKIILHAVNAYPWVDEAQRFVNLYTDKGMFSEISLLSMSQLLGQEWKNLAVHLKVPEVQVAYIESLKLGEQQAKGKLLDKFRLSYHAIQQGENLPHEFVRCLKECKCSESLLSYVQGKLE